MASTWRATSPATSPARRWWWTAATRRGNHGYSTAPRRQDTEIVGDPHKTLVPWRLGVALKSP
jgi:hypothetical protein